MEILRIISQARRSARIAGEQVDKIEQYIESLERKLIGEETHDVRAGESDVPSMQEVQGLVPGTLRRKERGVWEYIFWRQPHNEGNQAQGWFTLGIVMDAYASQGWELVSGPTFVPDTLTGSVADGHWYLTWRRHEV